MSSLLYTYCNGLLALGSRKVLMQDDLWAVSRYALSSLHMPSGGVARACGKEEKNPSYVRPAWGTLSGLVSSTAICTCPS